MMQKHDSPVWGKRKLNNQRMSSSDVEYRTANISTKHTQVYHSDYAAQYRLQYE